MFQEYIDRQSGSYSGGNKRKLNVAMSLVNKIINLQS